MTHDNAFKSLCDHADHLVGIAGQPDLRKRLEQLLDAACAEMMAAERRTDPMFGSHAATVALSHHAYGCEARLIEQATVLVFEEQDHLQVVRLDRAIPLVEAAWQALRGNDWSELEGIRLPSRVFAEESYMPDLVVIDRRSRDLFLFDIKRSVDSKPSRARGLMEKLKAAALVAPDWLSSKAKVHAVACTRIAILDASGAVDDPKQGILPLAALEQVLDIPGFAAALASLRRRFSIRLEQELDRLQAATWSGERSEPENSASSEKMETCDRPGTTAGVSQLRASADHQPRPGSGRRVGFVTLPPGEDEDAA